MERKRRTRSVPMENLVALRKDAGTFCSAIPNGPLNTRITPNPFRVFSVFRGKKKAMTFGGGYSLYFVCWGVTEKAHFRLFRFVGKESPADARQLLPSRYEIMQKRGVRERDGTHSSLPNPLCPQPRYSQQSLFNGLIFALFDSRLDSEPNDSHISKVL